jgi:hypothetical protein
MWHRYVVSCLSVKFCTQAHICFFDISWARYKISFPGTGCVKLPIQVQNFFLENTTKVARVERSHRFLRRSYKVHSPWTSYISMTLETMAHAFEWLDFLLICQSTRHYYVDILFQKFARKKMVPNRTKINHRGKNGENVVESWLPRKYIFLQRNICGKN